MDTDKIEITNVHQLSDGRVLYHFSMDDDPNLRRIRFEYDDAGNKYCVPVRALITEKRWDGFSSAEREMILDVAEENAWTESQGIEREIVRAWEEGMDLPAASAADKAEWGLQAWQRRLLGGEKR